MAQNLHFNLQKSLQIKKFLEKLQTFHKIQSQSSLFQHFSFSKKPSEKNGIFDKENAKPTLNFSLFRILV